MSFIFIGACLSWRMTFSRTLRLGLGLWLCASFSVAAERTTPKIPLPSDIKKLLAQPKADRPDETTLKALVESIKASDKKLAEKDTELTNSKTPEERKVIAEELVALKARRSELQRDLISISASASYDQLFGKDGSEFTLNREMNDLLRPLLSSLKQATQAPRAIESLTNILEADRDRLKLIEEAITNATAYAPTYQDKEVQATIKGSVLKSLSEERAELENRIRIYANQLADIREHQESFLDSSAEVFRKYFRTRGWSLILALLTFALVFFGARFLHQYLHRYSPLHRPERRSFYSRLADVIYYVLSFVGAVFAALLVLYVRGDWMLLSFAILFLAGLTLAAKNGLPHFYEQTRLLLNLGEAREGERVVIGNVPWRVETLSFFSTLNNPWLKGGKLRLPLRQMAALVSRRFDEDEPWFPSKVEDWVALDDGTFGKVILQSPEQVQLVMLGGSRKTYRVGSYLDKNPRNLSTGFRITAKVALNLSSIEASAEEMVKIAQEQIQRGLLETMEHEALRDLAVDLTSISETVQGLHVTADFAGELAPKYDHLGRLLQKLVSNLCLANSWKSSSV